MKRLRQTEREVLTEMTYDLIIRKSPVRARILLSFQQYEFFTLGRSILFGPDFTIGRRSSLPLISFFSPLICHLMMSGVYFVSLFFFVCLFISSPFVVNYYQLDYISCAHNTFIY